MRAFLLAAFAVVLLAITNLPWTLDDYDQAKQAYTSFEMVRQNHWLYQHTPNEHVATKPPLVGWVSAAIFGLTRSWSTAWRLPSFLAALGLLWLLAREAAVDGTAASLFAMSAFALNLLSARLATLVRTDMPLALGTFLIGWLILRKLRRGERWNAGDRWVLCAVLAITLWIKGPIVYAFILPGLVVYQVLRRKTGAPSGWSGWWPWILSLIVFLAWVVGGIVRQPGFYETVVVKEFAARFTETIHKPQPLYFYLPHLLQKFAPWSVLLLCLTIILWRRREKMRATTLWLVCWSVGGLVVMSIIPSKRVDRIFPVVPPFCLLLGAQIAAVEKWEDLQKKMRPWLTAALIFGCVFTGGYTAFKIGSARREKKDALVRFSAEVRFFAEQRHWRYEVSGGREEGMLLYLRRDHFLRPDEAARRWRGGELDALVVPNESIADWLGRLPDARGALVSERSAIVAQYALLLRERAEKPASTVVAQSIR